MYLNVLRWISSIEIDLPKALALNCITHIGFFSSLVIRTMLPLALMALFRVAGWAIGAQAGKNKSRREDVAAAKEKQTDEAPHTPSGDSERQQNVRGLARLCSSAWFYILFCAYATSRTTAAFL